LKNKKKIVFLGASITQGVVSSSYVKKLKAKMGTRRYTYINHGVAGYESYNVLKKLDKSIMTMPDFVILLAGTNDVLSSLDPRLARLSIKLKGIPHEPELSHYSRNIMDIVRRLKKETGAKIAVASLPVLGENLDSAENKTIAKYNVELKNITEKENVEYLPVYEKQRDFLIKEAEGRGKDYIRNSRMAFRSLVLHFLFFRRFDDISRKNGFLLLTDGIHMNSKGAAFIADAIEGFIFAN
jgi:lysophospholipase L1-like esterase